MADIEQRGITRREQRRNYRLQRFLYHALTGVCGRIRTVSIASGIPAYIIRRRLRRGWSAYDAVNTEFSQPPAPDNLLLSLTDYWRMDETSGSRLPGIGSKVLYPNASIGSVTGKNGNAASFDNEQHLYSNPFVLSRPYCISFWVYVPSSGLPEECDVIVDKNSGQLQVQFCPDGSIGFIADGGSFTSVEPSVATLDQWNFVVFNLGANGRMKASNNGETLISGGIANNDTGDTSMRVGSLISPGVHPRIDSLFIFNREITQAEIARLYNGGAGYFP